MTFTQEKEDVNYTLVSVIMHEENSMSSDQYYCDILYFNIIMCYWFDDDIIKKLRGLPDSLYSDASDQTTYKEGE